MYEIIHGAPLFLVAARAAGHGGMRRRGAAGTPLPRTNVSGCGGTAIAFKMRICRAWRRQGARKTRSRAERGGSCLRNRGVINTLRVVGINDVINFFSHNIGANPSGERKTQFSSLPTRFPRAPFPSPSLFSLDLTYLAFCRLFSLRGLRVMLGVGSCRWSQRKRYTRWICTHGNTRSTASHSLAEYGWLKRGRTERALMEVDRIASLAGCSCNKPSLIA